MASRVKLSKILFILFSHICLLLIYLAERVHRLCKYIYYLTYYKIYYLNNLYYFCAAHNIQKLPKSIAVNSSSPLSQSQINLIYKIFCIYGIKNLTIFTDSKYELKTPLAALTLTNTVMISKKNSVSQLLDLCRSTKSATKDEIVKNSVDLLISCGRRGMQMGGISLDYIYSSEIYHIHKINEIELYEVLKRFSESEQRNGR